MLRWIEVGVWRGPKTPNLYHRGHGGTRGSFCLRAFLLNLNHAGWLGRFDLRYSRDYFPGEFVDRFGVRGVFTFEDYGFAAVAGFAHFGIEFDVAEERDAILLGHIFGAAAGEDIDLVIAVRAGKETHVFDHPDDIHFHLLEHFDGFAGVLQGDIGWGGDDDRTGERNILHER